MRGHGRADHGGAPATGPWRTSLACAAALMLSGAPLLIVTQSLFLGPMTRDLNWTTAEYYAPLALAGLISAIVTPAIGLLADKVGLRAVMLPAIVVFSLFYAGLGFVSDNLAVYAGLIVSLWVLQAAHGGVVYAKAVLLWPGRNAGVRLAVALCGTAVGNMLVPLLAAYLIDTQGWRSTRIILAGITLVVCLPLAWAFIRGPAGSERRPAHAPLVHTPVDVARRVNVLRTRELWLILLAIGPSGMAINSVLMTIVPILTAKGVSYPLATLGISIIAGAQIGGRLCSGALLDVFPTPRIGVPLMLSATIAVLTLTFVTSNGGLIAGLVLLGLGLGAEMEVGAYFVRRYFSVDVFSRTYGYLIAIYTIGATSGPGLLAYTHDMTQNYQFGLLGCAGLLAISLGSLLALPPYPPDDSPANARRSPSVRWDAEPA